LESYSLLVIGTVYYERQVEW